MGVVQAIKLMRSSIPGQIPALPMAQVAVNLTDKILFVGYDGTTANVIKFVDMSGVASMISTATSELEPSDIDAAPIDHTMYVGTTALALNRASASIALTGITSIDGSAAKLTTPRALTIGSTAKNFDGSVAVSWSLEDINTHLNTIAGLTTQGFLKRNATTWVIDTTAYLPIAGGTLTGTLTTMLLKPSAHATYDIGLTGTRYRHLYLSGDVNAGGDVLIEGNLTVNGATVTANVETITVEDPIITLGGTSTPTVNDGKDRGIEFHWYDEVAEAAKKGFFGFDRSAQKFTFIPDAVNTNEVFDGAVGTIVANFEGALTGNASTATKLETARNIWGQSFDGTGDISGAITGATTGAFSGNVTIGGTLGVATGTTTLAGGLFDHSQKTITFSYGVGITSGALTLEGKETMKTPYIDFFHYDGTGGYSRIIETATKELSIYGGIDTKGKIKLKSDTYAEKALYIGGANGAKLVFVPASGNTPAYLKLANYDDSVMHLVTTGGVTMYSTAVPAGGGGGSATVILNGETNDNPTFWAPIVAGTTTGQYIKWNHTTGIPEWGTLPTVTKTQVENVLTGSISSHYHTFASLGSKPNTIDGYGITDAVYSSHLTGGSAHGVATTGANGFMSSGDKTNLNLLYANRLIYDAGDKANLAAALTSIPSTFYKEGLLLKYADSNEQHIYMYISTEAMNGETKILQGNWLRISKPDVDGGTY